MEQDIQRIGIGNKKYPSITQSELVPGDGDFTFDSNYVTFDSVAHTFDEELVVVPVVVRRDFSNSDYSNLDYSTLNK